MPERKERQDARVFARVWVCPEHGWRAEPDNDNDNGVVCDECWTDCELVEVRPASESESLRRALEGLVEAVEPLLVSSRTVARGASLVIAKIPLYEGEIETAREALSRAREIVGRSD